MMPITSFAKIEYEFMSWAETERVSELLKRRMLVQYRELKEIIKQHQFQRHQAGLLLLVPESSVIGYDSTDDFPQITWTEGRVVSNQGTISLAQKEENQPDQAEGHRVLAIEHRAQEEEKTTQDAEKEMIENQTQGMLRRFFQLYRI
ncbi:hypothetical protein F511_25141 [Dorcoceras hygrometricum]|uniref:Uncharacterized protein n=1 Tax=Dorcoceras hygrometricum TaxID=472368 RepID=A0A2Z7CR54_9LAMI|nr:hypothetical protein F511_25141 [Dorcoceras hygrometricum]